MQPQVVVQPGSRLWGGGGRGKPVGLAFANQKKYVGLYPSGSKLPPFESLSSPIAQAY